MAKNVDCMENRSTAVVFVTCTILLLVSLLITMAFPSIYDAILSKLLRDNRRMQNVTKVQMLTAFAILCAGFGLFGIFVFPLFFQHVLRKQLLIQEGTASYAEWVEPSVPVYTKMYLFSLLNPKQFLARTELPKLREMGPYTFREKEAKVNITWHPDNDTVSYRVQKHWYFEQSLSRGSLSDVVTTVNLPVIGAGSYARNSVFLQWGLSSTFETLGSTVFVDRTVGELLFDGYEDTLLAMAEWFGKTSTSDMPMDRFGWFYKRNGTSWADGLFNMHTGASDVSQLGRVGNWNHRSRTHFDGDCGRIHGSAGGLYPPSKADKGHDELMLFSHETCRTLTFVNRGPSTIEDIPSVTYELDETSFANASVHPSNACFHNDLPSGLQNNSRCKRDSSPAFLSFPRFHLADPFYRGQFQKGTFKEEEEQQPLPRIVLEPTTGIPLEVLIRLQINIKLDPAEGIKLLESLPPGFYFPVLWFEAHALATPAMAQTLRLVLDLPWIVEIVGSVLTCLGLCGAIVCFVLSRTCRGGDDDNSYSLWVCLRRTSTKPDFKRDSRCEDEDRDSQEMSKMVTREEK